MPAYNAARTLRQTYDDVIAQGIVDRVIVVDDASHDATTSIARTLPGVRLHTHPVNRGYGANQKTCYRLALEEGADIVIMVHPDYQYTPRLIPAMASLVAGGLYPVVLGSRILGGRALAGGMPLWKYVGNRLLTLTQNILFGAKLSEYHTGYRAFSRDVLALLPLEANSDDFDFDSEVLAEILWFGHLIGEVTCPTTYFPEASSIGLGGSVRYGIGCLRTAVTYRLARAGLVSSVFASLQATDDSGNVIRKLGAQSILRMRVSSDSWSTLGDLRSGTGKIDVPLFSFNETTGQWERAASDGWLEDGAGSIIPESELSAIRDGSYAGSVYAVGNIDHLSYWNVDWPVESHGCVQGTIVDENGNPVSGATVRVEGVTYDGSAFPVVTGSDGSFCADVLRSEAPDEDLDGDGTPDVIAGGARGLEVIYSSHRPATEQTGSPQHPGPDGFRD